jgi:hypothetical protein
MNHVYHVYGVFQKLEELNSSVLLTLFSGSKAKEKAVEHSLLKLKFMISGLYGEWDMYYKEFNEYINISNSINKEKLYDINKEILEWSNADNIGDVICKDYADFDLFCRELSPYSFPVRRIPVIDTDRMSEV